MALCRRRLAAAFVWWIEPNYYISLLQGQPAQPLPVIDFKHSPRFYQRIRRRLNQSHGIKQPQLRRGKNVIELTPIISQPKTIKYINSHFDHPGSQQIPDKLLNQQQAA
jgi:hypothetical protein